ncbi:MAG TPA: valine--tRNA ligase [Thermoleophilia bacterium]|nr:valine--tRNA ligase [Thermoleophilia bacterium]
MSDALTYLKGTTRFEPAAVEARWTREWLESRLFHAEPDPSRAPYSIVIPPPNVTGNLHMGHALNGTIQDVLIRYHRMLGENACWLPGTDHAGIATQNVVEKQLRAQGLTKEDLGREEFAERVWAWRREYGGNIINQLKRLGCACDYERERFTFDEGYVRAVLKVFVALHKKGYIYKDSYLVNWCPRCGTAISDLEVAHVEDQGHLYHVRYELEGGGGVTIATTRPETMLGDTAVAVNPDDGRYAGLVGRTAVLPLLGRKLPVIADARVEKDFGSGALKITPAHDITDFEIGRDHRLDTVQAIGTDGVITEAGGPYAGLEVMEARRRVIADLEKLGALEKVEDYPHSVASCDRCGTFIEPLISEQWFMDMDELRKPATEVVRDGRVRFTPERWGRVYVDWMDNLRPWCISRQLWWGHQLPVWYCEAEGCGEVVVEEEAPQACPACGGRALRRDTDVLDTWFSSALWPVATWGWPDETPDLAYFYPTNVLSTAREIIFLWVARMVMMGVEFVGEIPFSDVYIHSVIQAADGRRMSKSLGTGIDPLEMIDKYGADATRFGLLVMSSTQDVRFSEERIAMGRGFANKLWNASRLVLLASEGCAAARSDAHQVDRWIASRFRRCLAAVEGAVAAYDFARAVDTLYHFVWDEFCDWYLEMVKPRLYGDDEGERRAAAGHARWVLDGIVRLLHPFLPYVTEEIAAQYGAAPLLAAEHPRRDDAWLAPDDEAAVARVQAAVNAVRAFRAESGVAPGQVLEARFVADEAGAEEAYRPYAPAFRALARVELATDAVGGSGATGSGAGASAAGDGENVLLVPGGRLVVAAVVDRAEEAARLEAQLAKLEAEVARGTAKLGNAAFVEKAPPAVVEKERAKLAGYRREAEEVAVRLAAVRGG